MTFYPWVILWIISSYYGYGWTGIPHNCTEEVLIACLQNCHLSQKRESENCCDKNFMCTETNTGDTKMRDESASHLGTVALTSTDNIKTALTTVFSSTPVATAKLAVEVTQRSSSVTNSKRSPTTVEPTSDAGVTEPVVVQSRAATRTSAVTVSSAASVSTAASTQKNMIGSSQTGSSPYSVFSQSPTGQNSTETTTKPRTAQGTASVSGVTKTSTTITAASITVSGNKEEQKTSAQSHSADNKTTRTTRMGSQLQQKTTTTSAPDPHNELEIMSSPAVTRTTASRTTKPTTVTTASKTSAKTTKTAPSTKKTATTTKPTSTEPTTEPAYVYWDTADMNDTDKYDETGWEYDEMKMLLGGDYADEDNVDASSTSNEQQEVSLLALLLSGISASIVIVGACLAATFCQHGLVDQPRPVNAQTKC